MNVNDFVILPGSKAGTSVRLKTKTVKEMQLEKAQLETENKEMERRLLQLQSNMSREKEERRRLGAYHWKSGQAGPRTPQTRAVAQNNENRKKVSPQRVKLQVLKQVQEPVKKPVKPKRANPVAHDKLGVKGVGYRPPQIKGGLLEPASASSSASPGKQDRGLLLSGAFDEKASAESFQEALLQWRRGESGPGRGLCATEVPSAWSSASPGKQDTGLLLSGAFDEKASAESFQEALLQWRRGESGPGAGLCATEVPSESVENCEVQTTEPVKEPIRVEFQKDGLSYMEKLLLKKYRRTPVDRFFASSIKDSRPVQALSVQQDGAEGGGQGDDDDDGIEELTDEEVKKYWASVYRAEESNTVSENAEPLFRIEILDDSQSEDLEESSDSSVEETGDVGMNKQGKTDPVEGGRNPVSPKEIPQEKWIVRGDVIKIKAGQEESTGPKAGRGSLSSCELPEEIPDPTEGVSKDPPGAELGSSRDLEPELQQGRRERPQEPGRVCSTQSLVLPGTATSSALQDVAKRQKCGSTSYQGLAGFFVVGANPKQEKLGAPSSLSAASSPRDRTIPFPGDEQWVSERSLSEFADDSVVQGVLESELNRAAKALQAQNQLSHLMAAWMPWPDISGCENHSSLACEDGTSPSRAMEKIPGNADFQSTLELEDHDTFDIFGDWEESQVDAEEAILEDKQQVLALQ